MNKAERRLLEEYCEAISPLTRGGFHPFALVTHAWHESGGFRRPLGNSEHKYNLHGIKPPRAWVRRFEQGRSTPYPFVSVRTHEYIDGKKVYLDDYFIDFPTMWDSVKYYSHLLFRLYTPAIKLRIVPALFFEGLVSGRFRWATDPNYPKKLTRLHKKIRNDKSIQDLLDTRMREWTTAMQAILKPQEKR